MPCSLCNSLSSIASAFVLSDPHLPDCPIVSGMSGGWSGLKGMCV